MIHRCGEQQPADGTRAALRRDAGQKAGGSIQPRGALTESVRRVSAIALVHGDSRRPTPTPVEFDRCRRSSGGDGGRPRGQGESWCARAVSGHCRIDRRFTGTGRSPSCCGTPTARIQADGGQITHLLPGGGRGATGQRHRRRCRPARRVRSVPCPAPDCRSVQTLVRPTISKGSLGGATGAQGRGPSRDDRPGDPRSLSTRTGRHPPTSLHKMSVLVTETQPATGASGDTRLPALGLGQTAPDASLLAGLRAQLKAVGGDCAWQQTALSICISTGPVSPREEQFGILVTAGSLRAPVHALPSLGRINIPRKAILRALSNTVTHRNGGGA